MTVIRIFAATTALGLWPTADAWAASPKRPSASVRAAADDVRGGEPKGSSCPAPKIKIEAKTPVRRGPGLNYPVVRFLETDHCTSYGRISVNRDWVLVDLGELVGWVPARRLDRSSQLRIQDADLEQASPVGSGDFRDFVTLVAATPLRAEPSATSEARRMIPRGTRVVPLQVTSDDRFVEVRDDRGERGWIDRAALDGARLENVPRTSFDGEAEGPNANTEAGEGVAVGARGSGDPTTTDAALGSRSGVDHEGADGAEARGPALDIRAFGLAMRPSHRFDSDGVDATRRYQLSSFAPGAGLEVGVGRLGPIALSAGYALTFVLPTGPGGEGGDNKARGIEQEAFFRVGLPIDLGPSLTLTPSLGYFFGEFNFEPALPNAAAVQFLSTDTHAGSLGLRLAYDTNETNETNETNGGLEIRADLHGLIGLTIESPYNLGRAGPGLGATMSAGAGYRLGAGMGVFAEYALTYRRVHYAGAADVDPLDPTITTATLVDLTHGLRVGVSITFDLK
ncbi:MAG: hypothetical protein H6729_03410 [Deltaproteobacteria bacterium]|nr:hypothetical protein [Deltaproteobacteria bacterium]